MITRHKLLPLDEAQPGMVLSQAVIDERGMVLLPPEATLTEATLRSLARRGIEQLAIIDDSVSQAELEAELARQRIRLARLFRHYPDPHGAAGDDLLQASVRLHRLGEGK